VAEARSFALVIPEDELDFDYCISSGQVFRWWREDEDHWLGVDGENWFSIRRSDELVSVESNSDVDAFRSVFRLDWDAKEVSEEILKKAPELAPYLTSLKGHRLMRPSDNLETFFCFLCTPNNNIKRILQMVKKLADRGAVLAQAEGRVLHRFPEAEVIAAIPEEQLRAEGFGYRARTIPHLANELVSRGGRKYLTQLAEGPYNVAHKELLSMKGIGPKLADCICLFALHFDEAVPIDTHIWQAMCRLYFPEWKGTALTDKKYYEAADFFRARLGKLAGWAHQYLFYDNVLNWRSRVGKR